MLKSLAAIDSVIGELEALPSKLPRNVRSKTTLAAPVDFAKLKVSDGMMTVLKKLFTASLQRSFPSVSAETLSDKGFKGISITMCAQAKYGDLQCNSAMSLFKVLKQCGVAEAKKPQDVAAALMKNLPEHPMVGKTAMAGAGFINITLAPQIVLESLLVTARHGPVPPSLSARDKTQKVLVDFSSPNVAKEMHVGHLRSTIIGDSICRVLEYCGADVLRVNHVGDWGTQFGMLIQYMKESYPEWESKPPNLSELNTFYKAAKNRFDDDEAFKAQARLNVPLLQGGDDKCRKIWSLLCGISRVEFSKVYDRLDVKVEEVGESFYNKMIPPVIEKLEACKLLEDVEGTDGRKARCMFRKNWQIPLFLRKSDGGFGYDSTDMAAIHYRLKDLQADRVVYVTDAGQKNHFNMCFDAARDAGWVGHQQLEHVGFGVICGDDGKRFKSRSGATVRLVDLLDASVSRMKASLLERREAGKTDLSDEDIDSAAATIGYGAVKYFDLKNNPGTNYVFSYDRMLDTRGDTAVYLLFAYARVASIIRKAEKEKGVVMSEVLAEGKITLNQASERNLAFELMQMSDVVNATVSTLQPNKLCEYLYSLSTKFTSFVTECKVLGSPEQSSRLLLCLAAQKTLARVFLLLGLKPLNRI